MNWTAITLFIVIVAITLGITWWASRRTKNASDFYTAGGGLNSTQNALAISGDYMSAASFLGIAGMIAINGFDGFFYSVGFLVGYIVVLFLVAEPMRNLGKFTVADMITARYADPKVRGVAALNTIAISVFYMIAQLVGAGALIKLLLGLNFTTAVLIVGVLMTVYVLFGGMTATSWVQIVKAVLLIGGTLVITFMVFQKFGFSIGGMFDTMANMAKDTENTGVAGGFLNPGVKYKNGWDTLSLCLGLVLGTAGLPHILIRFFTVKNGVEARKSVVKSTWIIGIFYVMTMFLGFGAAAFVGKAAITKQDAAGNMAAPLLAKALGGDFLFAFICAVAFATILAVVAGLVLTGAGAFAHDFYNEILRKGKATQKDQMRMARIAAIGVAVVSILLSLGAEKMNVAFLVSLAFAVGASANLPVIVLTIFWKKFTRGGAITGMLVGLITSLGLVALSPNIWNPDGKAILTGTALYPLTTPGLFSIPIGFAAAIIGSLIFREKKDRALAEEKKFDEILVRASTGIAVRTGEDHEEAPLGA
ncbi:MAG: cation acetate symporter [Propionibacteriaceae bacterium]|nr:cation acetate symporter [Propionibacteriaceae bacterium]